MPTIAESMAPQFHTYCQTPNCGKGIDPRQAEYIYNNFGTITKYCWLCRKERASAYKKEHDKQQAIVNEQSAKNPSFKTLS